MSRKSRPPKPEKKGKKGKKGAEEALATTTITVEEPRVGAPYEVVVIFAAILASPTILAYLNKEVPFDAAAVRALIALGVSWVLTNLVFVVVQGMRPTEDEVTLESSVVTGTVPAYLPYSPPPAYAGPMGAASPMPSAGPMGASGPIVPPGVDVPPEPQPTSMP